MFLFERPENKFGGQIFTSPDGIHWTFAKRTSNVGDNTTIFYNPFRKKWVYSVRTGGVGRCRSYRECDDLVQGATWTNEMVHWASVDIKDVPDPWVTAMRPEGDDRKGIFGDPVQLYNLDPAPYESLMIGVFAVHYGPENNICDEKKMPKTVDLQIAYSRDGFHWDRPDRHAFIAAARKRGDWDFNYLHISSTVCAVFSDKIYFYYGAFSGESPKRGSDMYSGGANGAAILRRDGFASMTAAEKPGELTTRPVVFDGQFPFVNVNTQDGELTVEILNENGKPITGYEKEQFIPIKGDFVKQPLKWKGSNNLASLVGKPVRFRFSLSKGDLYAFWVSPNEKGVSRGFVAAGSPDYPGPADQ
jgi:hypothetical protein